MSLLMTFLAEYLHVLKLLLLLVFVYLQKYSLYIVTLTGGLVALARNADEGVPRSNPTSHYLFVVCCNHSEFEG